MWVKIDDGLMENPKMIAIGIQGRALWLAGLCYANQQTTDGFIPDYMIPGLAQKAGVTNLKGTLANMIAVFPPKENPVWHRTEGGYQIHDYAEYQPTKEEVIRLAQTRSEAGKRGAEGRWRPKQPGKSMANAIAKPMANAMGQTMASDMAGGMANGCPVPDSRTPKKNSPRNAEGVTAPLGAGPAALCSLEDLEDPFEERAEYVVDDAWYEERMKPTSPLRGTPPETGL